MNTKLGVLLLLFTTLFYSLYAEDTSASTSTSSHAEECTNGGTGECKDCCEYCNSDYSKISYLSGAHRHEAIDYQYDLILPDGTSCGPCGGSSTSGPRGALLPRLKIERFRNSRAYWIYSSFGNGWQSNFDYKIMGIRKTLKTIDGVEMTDQLIFDFHSPYSMGVTTAFSWSNSTSQEVPTAAAMKDQHSFYQEARAYDAQNQLTVTKDDIVRIEVEKHNGTIYHFETFLTYGKYFQARITKISDRNNNSILINYDFPVSTTHAELGNNPAKLRFIDTVTDAYGQTADFTYEVLPNAYTGRITQIELPNNTTISYTYNTDGQLSGIAHPDGEHSTFSYAYDAVGQFDTVNFDDAGAETTHRRKKLYQNASSAIIDGQVVSTTAGYVSRIENGVGEVSYSAWLENDGSQISYAYLGGNELLRTDKYRWFTGVEQRAWATDFVMDNTIGYIPDMSALNWEIRENQLQSDNLVVESKADYYGRLKTAEADTLVPQAKSRTHADNSSSSTTWNTFNQPLLRTDRLNRQTKSVYDANGNLLSTTVAFGTANAATSYHTYNTKGQPLNQTDANGNVTDYVYDEDGFLIQEIQPADSAGGTRGIINYTYDSVGRLSAKTDQRGRQTSYIYDNRNRLSSIAYNDGSYEVFIYGSGADANLLVAKEDRNSNLTTFEYDNHGRVIKTTTAAGTPDAVEKTCQYLNATNDKRISCTTAGELQTFEYDYKNRLIASSTYPDANSTLTTSTEMDALGRKIFTTDTYGRRTFLIYDINDRVVRTVKETIPGYLNIPAQARLDVDADNDGYADGAPAGQAYPLTTVEQYIANLDRDPSANAPYLITDRVVDAEGQILESIDPRGVTTVYTYDQRGRRISTRRAAGSAIESLTTIEYDANSNVTASVDALANRNEMTYGGRNLIASRTVAAGSPVEATEFFTYYADGRSKDHTDFRGNTSTKVWHQCCGRPQAVIDRQGHVQVSNNDFYGNTTHTAVVHKAGNISDYHDLPDVVTYQEITTQYDARHRPIARTLWLQSLGDVDPNNVPIATDPTLGLTTHYMYYDEVDGHPELAPLLTELAADGIILGAPHSDAGQGSATIMINPEGEVQVSIQDGVGRTVISGAYDKDDFANGTYTLVTWSTVIHDIVTSDGLLETKQISALGFVNKSRSDGAGRTLEVEDAEGNISTREYDANGNVLSSRDANGVGQDCVYDDLNRDIQCTDTAGSVVSKTFDLNNNILSQTDAKGQITHISYDARNRRESTTDRLGGITNFTYDANSNLISITDAIGKLTQYWYNERNIKWRTILPDHVNGSVLGDEGFGIQTFWIDPLKRICRQIAQNGEKVIYNFDKASRLLQREYQLADDSVESTDTFTYDLASRPLTASKGRYNNTVTYTYDSIGRRKTETLTVPGSTGGSPVSFVTQCSYDADNREVSCTYPSGEVLVKGYTDRHQLESVSFNSGSTGGSPVLNYSFTYDNGMREATRTFGNNIVSTKAYNLDNTLENISSSGVTSGSPVLDYSYTYDANKNVLSETAEGALTDYSWTASFDALDRVTSWDRPGSAGVSPVISSQSWNLDLIGNWNSVTTDSVIESRTHNDAHELTNISAPNMPAEALDYDAKGNLQNMGQGSALWDQDNHLESFADNSAVTITTNFSYDALGRRVSKGDTLFVSHGQRIIEEYSGAGGAYTLQRSYVHGTYVDDIIAKVEANSGNPVIHYYHSDRQYNVRGLTDSTGNIDELYAYSVYGKQTVMDGSGVDIGATAHNNNYGFTGRYLDDETGLWYFRARYFSDELGRFISRDPLGYVDGMSLYGAYFAERFMLDPSGLQEVSSLPSVPAEAKSLGDYETSGNYQKYDYNDFKWVSAGSNKISGTISVTGNINGSITVKATGNVSYNASKKWDALTAALQTTLSGSISAGASIDASINITNLYNDAWTQEQRDVAYKKFKKKRRYIVICCYNWHDVYTATPPAGYEKFNDKNYISKARSLCPTYNKATAIFRSIDHVEGTYISKLYKLDPRANVAKYRNSKGETATQLSEFMTNAISKQIQQIQSTWF